LVEPDALHGISPLVWSLIGSDWIRTTLQLLFDAFSSCEPVPTPDRVRGRLSLENAMVPVSWGGDTLFWAVLSNAAADGKRQRVIDVWLTKKEPVLTGRNQA
jgi:hypothetical protein